MNIQWWAIEALKSRPVTLNHSYPVKRLECDMALVNIQGWRKIIKDWYSCEAKNADSFPIFRDKNAKMKNVYIHSCCRPVAITMNWLLSNWKLVLSSQLLMAGWAEKMNPIHNCYVGSHDLPTVQSFLLIFEQVIFRIRALQLCRKLITWLLHSTL